MIRTCSHGAMHQARTISSCGREPVEFQVNSVNLLTGNTQQYGQQQERYEIFFHTKTLQLP